MKCQHCSLILLTLFFSILRMVFIMGCFYYIVFVTNSSIFRNLMASNRGQGGIQQLLAAEQEAQHIVNAARSGKFSFFLLSLNICMLSCWWCHMCLDLCFLHLKLYCLFVYLPSKVFCMDQLISLQHVYCVWSVCRKSSMVAQFCRLEEC